MNPLDLIERNLVLDPVIELRGACRLVPGDPRRDLQIPARQASARNLLTVSA